MEIRDIYSEFNVPIKLGKALNLYYGGWEKCCPKHTFGPAIRQHYLLHYVTRGKGQLWINNHVYKIHDNTIFLIRPNIKTIYQADEYTPWEYCWLCIDGYDIEEILNNCGFSQENPLFIDKSDGALQNAIVKFIFEFEQYKYNEYLLLSQLYEIFGQMKKQIKQEQMKSLHVEKAVDFIYKHYAKNISVIDIANFLGIDRTYLYRLFKKTYDMSPQQFIVDFRLKTAMNKLESSNMSVAEIAEYCGFNDASAFCHQFKKVYKNTPLSYRKRPKLIINE